MAGRSELARVGAVVGVDEIVKVTSVDAVSEIANLRAGNDVADSSVAGHIGAEDFTRCAGLRQRKGQWKRRRVMRSDRKPCGPRKIKYRADADDVGTI